MKRMLIVSLLLLSYPTLAQKTKNEKAAWGQEEAYWRLLHNGDKAGYMALWDDRFVGWPRFESNPVDKDGIAASFSPVVGDVKLDPLSVREFGSDIVITFYRATFTRNGVTRMARLTHTWKRSKSGWRIIGGMSSEDTIAAR